MSAWQEETEGLLTEDEGQAQYICLCPIFAEQRFCGRMYTARPGLCLCGSNVFLQTIEEVRQRMAAMGAA